MVDGSMRRGARVAIALKGLNVSGVLVKMAERGQLVKLRCEMPTCYCPEGRAHFDPASQPMAEWAPNMDHYPQLKADGGKREPGNARLAHTRCNNEDRGWRLRIRKMLRDEKSLKQIADALNRKNIPPRPGEATWTADSVRWVYVS
jgi:hypothetical protein